MLSRRLLLQAIASSTSMIEGGPWQGTPERTNMVIASGDRVGADAAGLGLIRSFNKWAPVTSKPVWEQTQLKTAISLGIGKPKEGVRLLKGAGDGRFAELFAAIQEHTGL